jgi:hypothetical protein
VLSEPPGHRPVPDSDRRSVIRRGRGGRSSTRIPHIVSIALLATFTGGCAQILGVDGYHVGGGKRDGGPADANAGPDAKPPTYHSPYRACGGVPLFTPECASCADSDQVACPNLRACLADPTCATFTLCLEACGEFVEPAGDSADVPNPGCIQACRDTTNGGQDNSFPNSMNALTGGKNCAYGDCQAGSRWKCAGIYHWPAPSVVTAHIRIAAVLFAANATFLTAKFCDGTLGCPTPVVPPVAADGGSVLELDVPTGQPPGSNNPPYFELTNAGGSRTILFYPGHPILGNETLGPFGLQSDAVGAKLFADIGIKLDAAMAVLQVSPVADCTGAWAGGVHVTADGAEGYPTSPGVASGLWGLGTKGGVTSPGINGVVFPNLQPDRIVTVAADYGGKLVATERVELRTGAITALALYPARSAF